MKHTVRIIIDWPSYLWYVNRRLTKCGHSCSLSGKVWCCQWQYIVCWVLSRSWRVQGKSKKAGGDSGTVWNVTKQTRHLNSWNVCSTFLLTHGCTRVATGLKSVLQSVCLQKAARKDRRVQSGDSQGLGSCSLVLNIPYVLYILVYNSNKKHKSHGLFYLTTPLHVSGVTITHLQEHKKTVTTASGNRYTILLSAAIVEGLELISSLSPIFRCTKQL